MAKEEKQEQEFEYQKLKVGQQQQLEQLAIRNLRKKFVSVDHPEDRIFIEIEAEAIYQGLKPQLEQTRPAKEVPAPETALSETKADAITQKFGKEYDDPELFAALRSQAIQAIYMEKSKQDDQITEKEIRDFAEGRSRSKKLQTLDDTIKPEEIEAKMMEIARAQSMPKSSLKKPSGEKKPQGVRFAPEVNESENLSQKMLQDLKQNLTAILSTYFDQGTVFSRNHDARMKAVIKAINNAKDGITIEKILANQEELFSGVVVERHDPDLGIEARFTTTLKNRPNPVDAKGNFGKGFYYDSIIDAKGVVEQYFADKGARIARDPGFNFETRPKRADAIRSNNDPRLFKPPLPSKVSVDNPAQTETAKKTQQRKP